jgi:hypothetical protein
MLRLSCWFPEKREIAAMPTARVARSFALVILLALLLAPSVAVAREKPFPVARSVILKEGGVKYIVEGRVVIPKGVEISCQKDASVVGRGKGATLVIEGDLAVHGVSTREVVFENLTIELAEKFEECRLDMTILRKGARLRSASGKSVDGQLHIELTEFEGDSDIDVVFHGGSIQMRATCSDAPVKIKVTNPPNADGNRVKVFVFGCSQRPDHPGLAGGISVEGARDCLVRLSRIGGQLSSFRNCRTLQLDGVKIDSKRLELKQTKPAEFRRTKVLKCDIYSAKVAIHAPRGDGRIVGKVRFERCWFRYRKDPKTIHTEVLTDGRDDPRNAARIILGKVNTRPLELGGAVER